MMHVYRMLCSRCLVFEREVKFSEFYFSACRKLLVRGINYDGQLPLVLLIFWML